MPDPKAVKKSEMQQLTNESKKKINQSETRDCDRVVFLHVPPQGCEEEWNAAANQWEQEDPENQPIRDQKLC